MKVLYIVLASGFAKRFGKNKLNYSIENKTLFESTLDCVPFANFRDTVVVTQYDNIKNLCEQKNIKVVINDMQQSGIDYSIKTVLSDITHDAYDGLMFFVADQPYLERTTCEGLVQFFTDNPDKIVALGVNNTAYNPVIFPKRLVSEFENLPKNKGGKYIVKNHIEDLMVINTVDPKQLIDIDCKLDLDRVCV